MKKVGQQEVEIVLNGVRCLSCMQMKVTAQEEYIHEEVLNEKPLKRNKSAERESFRAADGVPPCIYIWRPHSFRDVLCCKIAEILPWTLCSVLNECYNILCIDFYIYQAWGFTLTKVCYWIQPVLNVHIK